MPGDVVAEAAQAVEELRSQELVGGGRLGEGAEEPVEAVRVAAVAAGASQLRLLHATEGAARGLAPEDLLLREQRLHRQPSGQGARDHVLHEEEVAVLAAVRPPGVADAQVKARAARLPERADGVPDGAPRVFRVEEAAERLKGHHVHHLPQAAELIFRILAGVHAEDVPALAPEELHEPRVVHDAAVGDIDAAGGLLRVVVELAALLQCPQARRVVERLQAWPEIEKTHKDEAEGQHGGHHEQRLRRCTAACRRLLRE
mmetsp:Transcript_103175/g.291767  ORF Transcript_103175/g.291767 Transcript_103175/m.291767 type:complete len:259 (-) Transcript_103175:792-1568(-)